MERPPAGGNNFHGQASVPAAMKYIVAIEGGTFHSVAISASSASYPKIDCPKLNTCTQGNSFSLDVFVKGLTAPVFSTSTLPAGLTLDAETGIISGIPSNPGLTLTRISAQSGSIRVSQIIAFSVQSIPFSDWLENYFSPSELGNPLIVGENADPDKDGRSNLEEFNSDTHPNSPDHASNLTIEVDSGYVRLHVRMRKETDQLIHTGEYSTDLSTWYPLTPHLELKSVEDHAASEILEYEVTPDLDPGPKVFFRYSIENQGED
ncbi:MAG: hypothetical protein HC888_09035 [Candidatus Competibacteraceae bacterium]|nr:hypothetical protein [Candidatus Competibacteraceae bacterium]